MYGGSRCGHTPDRHGLPPLPRCRLPDRACQPGAGPEHCMGHAAELRLFERRPDFGRAAQSARVEGSQHPAANLDHCQSPAQGSRRSLFNRSRQTHRARAPRAARRCHRDVQLRRCQCQSLDRPRCDQHQLLDRLPEGVHAAAMGVRGQRDRHFDQDTDWLDRGQFLAAARPRLLPLRRARYLRYLPHCASGG